MGTICYNDVGQTMQCLTKSKCSGCSGCSRPWHPGKKGVALIKNNNLAIRKLKSQAWVGSTTSGNAWANHSINLRLVSHLPSQLVAMLRKYQWRHAEMGAISSSSGGPSELSLLSCIGISWQWKKNGAWNALPSSEISRVLEGQLQASSWKQPAILISSFNSRQSRITSASGLYNLFLWSRMLQTIPPLVRTQASGLTASSAAPRASKSLDTSHQNAFMNN